MRTKQDDLCCPCCGSVALDLRGDVGAGSGITPYVRYDDVFGHALQEPIKGYADTHLTLYQWACTQCEACSPRTASPRTAYENWKTPKGVLDAYRED